MRQWCAKVILELPQKIGELYIALKNHAEEVYMMAKIRGSAQKLLKKIDDALMIEGAMAWNLHTLASVKTITTLYGKSQKIKGVTIIVVNTGSGSSFMEFL